MRYFFYFFSTLLLSVSVCAQIIPQQGDTLNYRLVGFSVPLRNKTQGYSFEFAKGTHKKEKSFDASIFKTEYTKDNQLVTELPLWRQDYTWRVRYTDNNGKKKGKSKLYHVATGGFIHTDTTQARLRVIDSATDWKDLLVILDSRVMYDMKGNPVWYLPSLNDRMNTKPVVRDLKPTDAGTFTFLQDNNAFEVDYNGNILWQAPHGTVRRDSQEQYHHEFTRLSNGHYMVADQEELIILDSQQNMNTILIGTLVEYDKFKNLVWHWKASNYFLNTPKYYSPNGQFEINTHMNGFYFNEAKKAIYVSFRNINAILKIAYPIGTTAGDYRQTSDPMFATQHSPRVGKDGSIYMFNNNVQNENPKDAVSYITKVREAKSGFSPIEKVWDFPCNIDDQAPPASIGGGSVYELPDGAILACMGITGRVFIVSPEKKVLWNALPEQKEENNWVIQQQYRASFIENKDALKKFIFYKPQ